MDGRKEDHTLPQLWPPRDLRPVTCVGTDERPTYLSSLVPAQAPRMIVQMEDILRSHARPLLPGAVHDACKPYRNSFDAPPHHGLPVKTCMQARLKK